MKQKINLKPRDWYYLKTPEERKSLATKLGLSGTYLRKVVVGERAAGRTLAIRLEQETPYDRHYWRPDIFGASQEAA